MTLASRVAELCDRAEADGGQVVAIQAVRQALESCPCSIAEQDHHLPSEHEDCGGHPRCGGCHTCLSMQILRARRAAEEQEVA